MDLKELEMQNPLPKDQHYTYGDYTAWPDDERWELIDGEAYDMSPAPSLPHQDVALKIATQITNFLRGRPCRVFIAPFDVRLPKANEADDRIDTVVQPDLSVVCDPGKLDHKGCRGAPDWVIEVLSPCTASKDQIRKRELYQRHGVREYWLAHPLDRILTLYRLKDGRFEPPQILAMEGTTPVTTLKGLEIDWEEVWEDLGPLD